MRWSPLLMKDHNTPWPASTLHNTILLLPSSWAWMRDDLTTKSDDICSRSHNTLAIPYCNITEPTYIAGNATECIHSYVVTALLCVRATDFESRATTLQNACREQRDITTTYPWHRACLQMYMTYLKRTFNKVGKKTTQAHPRTANPSKSVCACTV